MSDLTLDECKIKLGEVDAKCGDDGMCKQNTILSDSVLAKCMLQTMAAAESESEAMGDSPPTDEALDTTDATGER